jgi:hypothetical protein
MKESVLVLMRKSSGKTPATFLITWVLYALFENYFQRFRGMIC